jgi:ribosomal RNA assembly protein
VEEYVRVPQARIGALIGKGGKTKRRIEDALNITLDINTETGHVQISSKELTRDPLAAWKGRDIVRAVARGFSPQKALELTQDGVVLEIIDLENYYGKSENSLRRIRGRIIGKNGMTRKIIENMTGTNVSIYGRTVSIVGEFENVAEAKRAVEMLVHGSMHSTVYKFLESIRRKKKIEQRRILWR